MFAHTIALALSLLTLATAGNGVAQLCEALDGMSRAYAPAAPSAQNAARVAVQLYRDATVRTVASLDR